MAHGESYRVFSGLSALWVIPMIARLTLTAAREARRRSDGGAVIHGHWWFPCGLVAVAAGAIRGAASVVHLHGSDAAVTTNAVHRWLARRVLRRASAVVGVSDELRDWAASLVPQPGGLPPPPRAEATRRTAGPLLGVVPMPVGLDRVGPATPLPAEGLVLAVGRLMAEKGFDVLIEAVALMDAAERPEVVIVGDGPDRALLEALALRRGVEVAFVGSVSPGEMGGWYRQARLVCVPSRREGFGMVVAEALAAGRPVVATAVGAAPSFITENASGRLVPPGDPVALSAALGTALRSEAYVSVPDLLASLSPPGHATALLSLYGEANSAVS